MFSRNPRFIRIIIVICQLPEFLRVLHTQAQIFPFLCTKRAHLLIGFQNPAAQMEIIILLLENLSQKQIQVIDLHIQCKFFKIDHCHLPVSDQNIVMNIFPMAEMPLRQRLIPQLFIGRGPKAALDLLRFQKNRGTAGQISRFKFIFFIFSADKRIDLPKLPVMAPQFLDHVCR